MASTYENDLRLEEMATGENSGSWGTKTNTNLELIADAFSYGTETIANADTTITIADGAADAARSLALKINSSEDLTTTRVVTLAPNTTSKVWIIENNTSGGQTLTISAGSGSNITLLNGQTKIIATDGIGAGSNVVELTQDIAIADLFIDDDLSLQSDGAVINFGADSEIQLTHVADTGLLLTETGGGAPTLQFRDSALSISSSADGQLDIDSDGTIDINATTSIAFDTDTLYVDSANDRVGINQDTPLDPLHIKDTDAAIRFEDSSVGITGYSRIFNDNNNAITIDADAGNDRGSTTITMKTDGTSAMVIDSSQRVLIGDTSTQAVYEGGTSIDSTLQINNSEGSAMIARTIGSGRLFLARNQNVVLDSPLGEVSFNGGDGTNLRQAAKIIASVDGGPATGDMPGRLQFYTSADGGASPTERMQIDSQGFVGIGGSPDNSLHVKYTDSTVYTDDTRDAGIQIENLDTTTNAFSQLHFRTGNSDSYIRSIRAGDNLSSLAFLTDDGGTTGDVGEAMRIDSGQRVLVGYTANTSVADFNSAVQVVGQGTADFHGAAIAAVGFSNNSNGAYLNFGSGRSNTAGTFTSVANDDTIGQINFAAADGTDMNSRAALIMAQIDAAPSSNDTPGRIIFSTTADGASSPTEVMRLTNDRVLKLSSSFNSGSLTTFPSYSGEGAYLKGYVNGGGAGPYPRYLDIAALGDSSWGGVIRFLGNKDATATAVENARIDRDGHFKIGTVSGAGKLTVSNNQTAVDNLELAAFSGSDVNQRLTINNFFCGSDEDRVGLLFENQGTGNMRVWMGDDLKLYSKSGNPTSDNDGNYFVQVNSSGNIAMPSGNGIDFSATSNGSGTTTSEVLDDYEEGTWTPALFGGTTAGTMTGNTAGRYTKIGQQVFIEFRIDGVTLSGAVGTIHISGLPFTFSYGTNNTYSVATVTQMHKFNFTPDSRQSFYASSGGTTLFGLESRNGLNWVDWSVTNTTDLYMNVSMFYITTQ